MNIAIIGGGITGLSAAYRLSQVFRERRSETFRPVRITVFDKRPRLGGVLETLHQDGFQIEQSADNFITTVPQGIVLCKELGLTDDLVQTNPKVRRTYVVRKGKLHLLPDGFLMMAPTKLYPMAVTPLLSPWGKLRAGLEMFIRARKDDVDESMAHFVKRRLGKEVFERLIEPLVSGVYAADMEKLSILATLPRFRDMEKQYGSLIIAMQRQMKNNRQQHLAEQSGARYSMFVTLKSGLDTLPKTLAERTPNLDVRLNTAVSGLKADGRTWIVNNGKFDAVILACGANEAAGILSGMPLGGMLSAIQHEGTAIATFAFDTQQIKQQFTGMGFVVPKIESSPILAGSFSSLKYEHRAPQGKTLIRVFAGGARSPELAEMPDAQLAPLLLRELKRVIQIEGEPLPLVEKNQAVVTHWARTMPQYFVGHRERIAEIEKTLNEYPTLMLAGNYFDGVGIPQCIGSGFKAAEKIAENLHESTGSSK